jgi:hypothetical protein
VTQTNSTTSQHRRKSKAHNNIHKKTPISKHIQVSQTSSFKSQANALTSLSDTKPPAKMSRRNDTFLTLCLSQAECSPLHYRHGSIIVRGGKVIGQGFNTYRPGFDGGALKTGILPSIALDGPAIQQLKQRLKNKPKCKAKAKSKPDDQQENQQDAGTFMPFESMVSGCNSNTPLSMHSEMMAIRSALSLSSGTLSSHTSARAAAYYQKPCFRLPGDSKKRKARASGLKAYAEAVCISSEVPSTSTGKVGGGKCSVQEPCFEPRASQPGGQVQCPQQQQRVLRRGGGEGSEREEKYSETPEGEEEQVQNQVWVSVQRAVSRGFEQTLST